MDDDSVFTKWRALIALAHTDGKIAREERTFLIEHINKVEPGVITQQQKMQLIQDFSEPQSAEILFTRIDDKVELLDFLRLAYFLFWSDDHFDSRERRMFAALRESVTRTMNVSEHLIDQMISLEGKKKTLREILTEEMAKRAREERE